MKFRDYLKEAPIATKGWTKESVKKFGNTIGKSPDEHGFFDACVNRMRDEMGEKAEGFCAAVKDAHYGGSGWRGKGKSKKDIKKDVKATQFKKQLKESDLKDVPKEFMDDPLYKKVLTAKNEKEFKKALENLLSIRGKDAITNLQKQMKGK